MLTNKGNQEQQSGTLGNSNSQASFNDEFDEEKANQIK